jgi:hypothetical protein
VFHIRQDSLKRLQFLVVFDLNVLQCALRDGSYTPNCDYEDEAIANAKPIGWEHRIRMATILREPKLARFNAQISS